MAMLRRERLPHDHQSDSDDNDARPITDAERRQLLATLNTTFGRLRHEGDDNDDTHRCDACSLVHRYWLRLIVMMVVMCGMLSMWMTYDPPDTMDDIMPLFQTSPIDPTAYSTTKSLAALLPSSSDAHGTLVLYSYHERNRDLERDNLSFFINVALTPLLNSPNVHFIFIISSACSVSIPSATNVWIHHRHNYGGDLCAYRDTLESLNGNESLTGRPSYQYRYHCWINALIRGPFLSSPVSQWYRWLDYFTSQITSVNKLIGTSIICMQRTWPDKQSAWTDAVVDASSSSFHWVHLSSMFLVFDHIALSYIAPVLPCSSDINTIIFGGEVLISRVILGAGYNLVSQLLVYRGVNWTNTNDVEERCGWMTHRSQHDADLYYQNNYDGINISPFEVVFFKTNRNVDRRQLRAYTDWTLGASHRWLTSSDGRAALDALDRSISHTY